MGLKEALKAQAQSLGFSLVGVTTPTPPPHLEVYQAWLKAGRYAGMDYLATERALQRRADPCLILPECRSILVLGIRYPAPSASCFGKVAAYAWGEDYHLVIPRRLRALVAFLENQVGRPIPNRYYTDTGPLMERELAQRAGLGWIGKNTCLIHPRQGSYFLLAEILLGLELESDPPFAADHCGTCTRCIEACPTSCILPDRTLEAGRCISYLTIEHKGMIPAELRPKMGSWLFGCDICQQVCPWNHRFAAPAGDPAFAPRRELHFEDLVGELRLSPQAFNRKFRDNPVQRTKRRGYLRNVTIALANTAQPDDQTALQALAQTLVEEVEPLVRAHAAWALGCLNQDAARCILENASRAEQDPFVLAEIHQALNAQNQPPNPGTLA